LIIESRFNGPPGTGNGGYTAGLIATELAWQSPVQVTLKVPPPLDTPLAVTEGGEVYAGEQLIAQALPAELAAAPAAYVSYEEAEHASAAYPGFTDHPFPTCFVCGPARAGGDGLRIFPGPLASDRTAAPWQVPDQVSAPIIWAALDCPGGWAVLGPGRPYLLGRMVAELRQPPAPATACVVVGEVVATEGRKAWVRTSLYHERKLLARAEATWIALPRHSADVQPALR
jgi:hypothetical protein